MNNPMDRFQFQTTNPQHIRESNPNIFDIVSRAKRNPKEFEDYVRRTNPQAYQRALQIRNSAVNPQQVVMQMAQQQGVNPNILRMLDV